MKHLLLTAVIAAMLCLSACNSKPDTNNRQPSAPTPTETQSAPQTPEPPKAAETPETPETAEPSTGAGGEITALNFDKPTVVDFYATWCGPCKTIAPILQRLEAKYAGRVDFVRVDVDRNNALAAEWEIEAVPTLLFAADGKVVERSIGALSESEIEACIQKIL